MTIWEIIAIILVSGLVFGFISVMVSACISKIIDTKSKAHIDMTTNLFKMEIEYVDRLFDKYVSRIEKMVKEVMGK